METYIYFGTRIAVALYVFYRLYIIIFRYRLFGAWDRIPVKPKHKPELETKPVQSRRDTVVGKAEIFYLEELSVKKEPEVAESGPDDELIDINLDPDQDGIEVIDMYIPSENDLSLPDDDRTDPDLDYSSGCTFEELRATVSFMSSPTEDEGAKAQAAETLITIRNTDIFNFIENQVAGTEAVGRLMAECLDDVGRLLPEKKAKLKPAEKEGFNIDKYV